MGRKLLNFDHTSQYLLGFIATPLRDYGPVILTVGSIGLEFILLYYLYKKKQRSPKTPLFLVSD